MDSYAFYYYGWKKLPRRIPERKEVNYKLTTFLDDSLCRNLYSNLYVGSKFPAPPPNAQALLAVCQIAKQSTMIHLNEDCERSIKSISSWTFLINQTSTIRIISNVKY